MVSMGAKAYSGDMKAVTSGSPDRDPGYSSGAKLSQNWKLFHYLGI